MLFGWVIPESRNIDSAFSDEIVSDSVLVHDGHFQDIVVGCKIEGLVPDRSFAGLVFGARSESLRAELEDAVWVLGAAVSTMLEKNYVSWLRMALTSFI